MIDHDHDIICNDYDRSSDYIIPVQKKSVTKIIVYIPHCSSVIVTFIVHYIMMTSHCTKYSLLRASAALNSIRSLRNYFHGYLER